LPNVDAEASTSTAIRECTVIATNSANLSTFMTKASDDLELGPVNKIEIQPKF
jgi:hypothetical protein